MIEIILWAIRIFYYGLIGYCILSFVPIPQVEPVKRVFDGIYKPILDPISKLLYPIQKNLGLDFSPILLILLLNFISSSLVRMT